MAHSIVKGLALTFGGALALGVGIKVGQIAGVSRTQDEGQDSEGMALQPVLERLEIVEERIVQVEAATSQPPAPPEFVLPDVSVFEEQMVTHDQELESLRNDLRGIDERGAQVIEQMGKTIGELEAKLPSLIEVAAGHRFAEIEERLRSEMDEAQARTIEELVTNLQTKVMHRISELENDFAGQSAAIGELRDYSIRTDSNMQKLLAGVERLAIEIGKRSENSAPAVPRELHTLLVASGEAEQNSFAA